MAITQDQILSAVRWAVTAGAAYLVGKGIITQADVPTLVSFAIGAVPLATLVWGIIEKSKAASIAKVAAMPDVDKVVMTSDAAATAQKPSNVVGPSAAS